MDSRAVADQVVALEEGHRKFWGLRTFDCLREALVSLLKSRIRLGLISHLPWDFSCSRFGRRSLRVRRGGAAPPSEEGECEGTYESRWRDCAG
jgi:hypothetical protein